MPDQPKLVLDTGVHVDSSNDNIETDISSLPSPTCNTGVFEPFMRLPQAPLQRLPSVTRPPQQYLQGLSATAPGRIYSAQPAMDVVIPKRGEFVATQQLNRTTNLHREKQRIQTPYTPTPVEPHSDRFLDKQDVYIAFDKSLNKTTWDRIKALGKGSFSRVILATPTLSQVKPELIQLARCVRVAVKITKLGVEGTTERAQLEEAMRRDVGLVKRLKNPCVISTYAYNFDAERALIVLPYFPGGDLFELIARHSDNVPLALAKRIIHDIVSAVAYMHSENVVHRDLKLENILIALPKEQLLAIDPVTYPHPVAVVTDLGLARAIDPKDPMLTTRCGSEDYVPPEIILSQSYDGRQTDMWALGVLTYAVLEGRLPFDAPPRTNSGRVIKTAHRIARNDWTWYKVKNAHPEYDDLKALVEGCLRKRDNGRFLAPQVLQQDWYRASGPIKIKQRDEIDPCSIFVQI